MKTLDRILHYFWDKEEIKEALKSFKKSDNKPTKAEAPIFDAASFISSGLTGEGVTYKTLCDCYKSWVFTCIMGDEPILLADGTYMSIKSMVDNNFSGEVLSFNVKSNTIEKKKVVNWYKSKLGIRKWLKVSYQLSSLYKGLYKNKGIIVTNDHKILTQSGYVEAKCLTKNHKIATKYFIPNKKQDEILFGMMLGDGHVKRNFVFGHSTTQKEWFNLKLKALSGISFHIKNKPAYKQSKSCIYATSSNSPYWYLLRKKWYNGKIKRLPKNLSVENITPLSLATWYMDDGSLYNRGLWLCSDSFTKMENKKLISLLNRIGIQGSLINKGNNKYRIYIGNGYAGKGTPKEGNAIKFFKLIAPYIPSDMRYKIPKEITDNPEYNYNPELWAVGNAEILFDTPIVKEHSYISKTTYCIDVEDNHNFIVKDIVCHNCIDKISKTVASLPVELYFYKQKGSKVNGGMQIKSIVNSIKDRRERNYYIKENNIEKIRVFEHPVIDLFNNPNQIDTRMTLWINIMIRMELAGYCGVYMPKNVLGLPAQLWAFPLTENATLSVNTDPKTIIKNFSYRDNSVNITIERDEMLYMRYPHPGSPIYGQSPLLTQEYPYDIDKFLMQYMYSMLKNKSTFGNVFTTDHELTQLQITELQAMIKPQYEGATRSGKPIFTHSGLHLDNTKLGSTFKDLMINEAAQYASDRLITSYGMTPANVGFVKDINRSTSEVLDKNYYDQCIRPRCMLIEEFFEKELLPRYDEGLMLDFKIPNIADRALDLQERRENITSGYSTINEERMKEEGREPVEWGDEPWMPFSLSQPSKPKEPVTNIPQDEPNEINEENEANEEAGDTQKNSTVHRKAVVWTAERKRKASELFVKAVEARKNLILKVIIDHFNQQKAEVISNLESGGKSIVSNLSGFYKDKRRIWIKNNKAKLEDVNINVEEESQLLEKKLKPIITSIIMDVAEDRLDEFNVKFEFNVADKTVSQWLGKRLRDTAHDIEETTHDKINAVLREGFQEGLSVTAMAEQLKKEFEMFSQSRALMIARTETVSASNFADIEAVKQAGLDDRLRKFWLNEVDARDTHIAAGKQYDENNPIPLNQDFVVGQDTMPAPGNGSLPEENINCRCTTGFTEA